MYKDFQLHAQRLKWTESVILSTHWAPSTVYLIYMSFQLLLKVFICFPPVEMRK